MYYFSRVYVGFGKTVFVIYLIFCAAVLANGQSTDQNFPTPITSNELGGTIKARDIGDSRLTTYFFTFNGNQGDVFINIVTNNFNGDIDLFTVEGLRPLTKIVVYADSSDNETGRVIYLRKSEKVILRIQGRSPNDDPATFRIKFAGSFVPSADIAQTEEPKLTEIKKENESGIIVNSVGTIIAVKPKPTPETKERVAEKTEEEKPETIEEKKVAEPEVEKAETEKAETESEKEKENVTAAKPLVIITDELEKPEVKTPVETVAETEEKNKTSDEKKEQAENTVEKTEEKPEATLDETEKAENNKSEKEKKKNEKEPNPLENIRLIVLLKDGGKIERPMSEVLKFGVEKGILTIIHRDGSISRYSILDVESVTIR